MNCPHCSAAIEDDTLVDCPACNASLVAAAASSHSLKIEKGILDTYEAHGHEKIESTTHRSEIVARIDLGAGKRPQSAVLHGDTLLVLSIDGDTIVVDRFALDGTPLGILNQWVMGEAEGQIADPSGIALDEAEHVYLLDGDNARVVKLARDGSQIAAFGPSGINGPRDLEVGDDGSMLLADTGNHRIIRWNAAGERVLAIGPDVDEEEGETGTSGAGESEFDTPSGVTCDDAGAIYVADTNNHRVQIFDATGAFVRTFGTEGETPGHLLFPTDVRIGDAGDVFVFDLHGKRVQKFRPDGTLVWGIPVSSGMGVASVAGDIDVGADERIYVPLPAESAVVCVRLVD